MAEDPDTNKTTVTLNMEDLELIHSYLNQAYAYLVRLEEINSILTLKKVVSYSPLTLKIEQGVKYTNGLIKSNKPVPLKTAVQKATRVTKKPAAKITPVI